MPEANQRAPAGRTRLLWGLRLLLGAALLVGLVLLARRIGLRRLADVILAASPAWFAVALAAKGLVALASTQRFRRLASPWLPLAFGGAARIVFASYAATHLFGAGLSPAYRGYALARDGTTPGAAVTLVGLEKYLELMSFVVLVMPLGLALGTPPPLRWAAVAWGVTLVCGAAIAATLVVIARRRGAGRIGRMAEGLKRLRAGGHLTMAVALTVLAMAADVVCIYAAIRAAGAAATLRMALFA